MYSSRIFSQGEMAYSKRVSFSVACLPLLLGFLSAAFAYPPGRCFLCFRNMAQKKTDNLHPIPVSSSPVSFTSSCDFHFRTKAHVDGIMPQLIFVPRSSPLKMRKKTGFGLTPAACTFCLFASFLSYLISPFQK